MDGTQRNAVAHPQATRAAWQPSTLLVLLIITLSGLALRLYGLDATSLWSDEIFSAFWIRRDHAYLWSEGLFIETTPPLYYSVLKIWTLVFGDSDRVLRLLSVAFSTATIPLVYGIGSRLDRPVTGMVAAAAFAVMPLQIYYAQEARVYALLPLLVAMALLSLLRFAEGVEKADPGLQWRWLAAFGLAAVGLIYSHATSVFTVFVLDVCVGALVLSLPRPRETIGRLLIINLLVAALSLPQLAAILMQHARDDLEWIAQPGLVSVLNLANVLLVDPVTPIFAFRATSLLSIVIAVMFMIVLAGVPWDRRRLALLVGPPALFFILTLGISFYAPFLMPKIFIWFAVPLAVLVALACQSRLPPWLRVVFLASLLLSHGVGYHGIFVRTLVDKENWRDAIADVASRLAAPDLLCVGPHTSIMPVLRYAPASFFGQGRQFCRWVSSGRDDSVALQPDNVVPITRMTSAVLSGAASEGRCIWLVSRAGDWQRHQAMAEAALPAPQLLEQRYARIAVVAVGPACP